MQTLIAILIVAIAVCYMAWQWMPARPRKLLMVKLTGAADEHPSPVGLTPALVQRSGCSDCSTCGACGKGA